MTYVTAPLSITAKQTYRYYVELASVIKLTDSNKANDNGSSEYQPSETYEHIERLISG